MSYGERFKKALTIPGKTRKGVAAAMHVTVQAVGRIVNGQTKAASAEHNAAAAQYFGVDATWLATGRPVTPLAPTPASAVPAVTEAPIPYNRNRPSREAFEIVAKLIQPCSPSMRQTVAGLLHRLALDPDDTSLPDQIMALIDSVATIKETARVSNG